MLAKRLAWGTLVILCVWASLPILYLLLRARSHHESFSGAESVFPADDLQYFSWIRSSGEHILAADDFDLRTGGNVFLHPMFLLSGLLWRGGVGIALSYLVWLPVSVVILFVGFRQFIRRMLDPALARAAALGLALFFTTPVAPLSGWTVHSPGLVAVGTEMGPTAALWGYFPATIAVGLMPIYVLAIERLADEAQRRPGRSARWYLFWAAIIGMTVSWVHPWHGEILLGLTGLLLILDRFRQRFWPLLAPALATAVPLGYYLVLFHKDAAWRIAQTQTPLARPSGFLVLLALVPVLVFVLAGARGRWRTTGDRLLVAWPVAALAVYFVSTGGATHALEGLSLPLIVLAVRGWQRMTLPVSLALPVIIVATVPGLIYFAQFYRDAARTDPGGMLFRPGETKALAFLTKTGDPGGVLPSLRISAAVPSYTGRRTWLGHTIWTPNFGSRVQTVAELFSGRQSPVWTQALLRRIGARYVLADCEPRFGPLQLGRLLRSEHRFGCVAVYELATTTRTDERADKAQDTHVVRVSLARRT